MNLDIDISSISELITGKLEAWLEAGIAGIPNFIAAVIIILIFALVANIATRIIRKILHSTAASLAVIGIVTTVIRIIVLCVGLFVALGVLNLDKTVTSLLAGAGVLGLALGFAFQEIASNFVAGVMIAFRQPYRVGDIVEVDGTRGWVTKIDLRTTLLTTFDGLNIFVPNKTMFTQTLINYTMTDQRRLEISVGISYGDDLEKVEAVIKEACENTPGRIEEKEIKVFYEEFGSSSINLMVFIWIHYPGDQNYLHARHHAIINIKKAFDKNNITIPFPIRTLDFGIKGGEKLASQLDERD